MRTGSKLDTRLDKNFAAAYLTFTQMLGQLHVCYSQHSVHSTSLIYILLLIKDRASLISNMWKDMCVFMVLMVQKI